MTGHSSPHFLAASWESSVVHRSSQRGNKNTKAVELILAIITGEGRDGMSRASTTTPPETPTSPPPLSEDDLRVMGDVRRDVWMNGLRGLVYGGLSGYGLHTLVRVGDQRLWWTRLLPPTTSARPRIPPLVFTPNTALVSFLLGGAVGSYIMAVTAGKNSVHRLHDIFENGQRTPPTTTKPLSPSSSSSSLSSYKQREENKEKEDDFYTAP
jgi:hypothetical protein